MVYSQIQKGTLLIATPEVDTGLFCRAVILVCEHNTNGSFGLVINKKLEFDLPEEIVSANLLDNTHISIRAGGPVQTNQMMLLHTNSKLKQPILEVCSGVFLGGDLQFLQDAVVDPQGPYVHLCFGYAGWDAGQLEREFLDGGWFVHPGAEHTIFHLLPETMWAQLLREMGGKYATLSMIPEDLSVN